MITEVQLHQGESIALRFPTQIEYEAHEALYVLWGCMGQNQVL